MKFCFWPYSFFSFIYFYVYCPFCEYRTSCAIVYMGRLEDNVWQSIISYPLGFQHLISGDQTCSACAFIYWTILPALLLFFSGVGCFYNFIQMTPKTRKNVAHSLHTAIIDILKMNVYTIWVIANFSCTINLEKNILFYRVKKLTVTMV